MRYAVDLRHPLQAPCGSNAPVEGAREDIYLQSSRPWECGNPEGISKECGKGGKPASWLSMLSILCHFHGLLFRPGDARFTATSTNEPHSQGIARRDRGR